jgi:hypothetical protein
MVEWFWDDSSFPVKKFTCKFTRGEQCANASVRSNDSRWDYPEEGIYCCDDWAYGHKENCDIKIIGELSQHKINQAVEKRRKQRGY